MKTYIKRLLIWFVNSWNAETPKIYKFIRNFAGSITAGITVLDGLSRFTTINTPSWFADYGWYVASASALITLYSGTRKVKEEKK